MSALVRGSALASQAAPHPSCECRRSPALTLLEAPPE